LGPVPPLESEAFDRLDSGPEQPTAHYRMVSGADHLNTLADTTKDAQVRIDATSSSTAIAARSLKYVPLRAREIIIKRCAGKALRGSSRALRGLFLPASAISAWHDTATPGQGSRPKRPGPMGRLNDADRQELLHWRWQIVDATL